MSERYADGDVMERGLWRAATLIAIVIGVAVGLPSGYGLGRLVETQLFGLDARDPLTYAAATVTLRAADVVRHPLVGRIVEAYEGPSR